MKRLLSHNFGVKLFALTESPVTVRLQKQGIACINKSIIRWENRSAGQGCELSVYS